MTREEAIKALKCYKKDGTFVILAEALDMAIKALEQEPCDDCIFKKEWEKIFSLIEERLLGDKE